MGACPHLPPKSLDELVEAVSRASGPMRKVAIARSANAFVLRSALYAHKRGLAEPIFIGDAGQTLEKARECGLDLTGFRLIDVADDAEAVNEAVRLYKTCEASLIMKGLVSTNILLKAVLDKEKGVPPKGILSHVAVFAPPDMNRLMLMSDAGVNIKPTLQRKVEIVKNALAVARKLGIEAPRVAMLAATEKVNYPAMPATLDAELAARMAEQGEFGDAVVAGPLSLDLAVALDAARNKGVDNPVAGRADILCVPDIESGNILYKSLSTFLRLDMAGVVVGSGVPIVVPSRGDSERSKFYSLALAVFLSEQGGC
jgi:phosphate butyryltransferase